MNFHSHLFLTLHIFISMNELCGIVPIEITYLSNKLSREIPSPDWSLRSLEVSHLDEIN